MKEKKFLKRLNNDRLRESENATCDLIKRLLKEDRSLIKRKIKLFPSLFKRKSASQIIRDNFQFILDNTLDIELYKVLIILMENVQTAEIVKDNFETVISRYSFSQSEREKHYKATEIRNLIKSWFLARCVNKWEDANKVLMEHIEFMLQEGITLTNVHAIQGLSKELDEILNQRLEEGKGQVVRDLLREAIYSEEKNGGEISRLVEDYALTMETLIGELLVDQNARMIDLQWISNGTYNYVYQIKDKVLKIGSPRETYEIPYHPRILQPLTRTNLIDEKNRNQIFACIEIADNVETLCKDKNQAEEMGKDKEKVEKLYQIYKELREDGIIWTDARFANVGILKRPNIPTLNGEEIDVDPQAIGMLGKTKGKVLGAEEWVIIDTNFLYRENNFCAFTDSYSIEFEKRWQQERQEKIAKQEVKDKKSRRIEGTKEAKEL
ncbi:MAG: hypothetical protein HFJ29_07490 [Clostridia bacterium]|nr:hypothetical protein [Clostridia bacterium]